MSESQEDRRDRKRRQQIRVVKNRDADGVATQDITDVEMVYFTTSEGTRFHVYFVNDSISVSIFTPTSRISVRPHDLRTVNIRSEK